MVLDYLEKNLNDANGLEVVEWGESRSAFIYRPITDNEELQAAAAGKAPTPHTERKPVTVMRLKYRAKNGLGAKIITEEVFLIVEGQVLAAVDTRDEYGQFQSHDKSIIYAENRAAILASGRITWGK